MNLREVMPGEESLPNCSVCGAMVKGGKCLSCGEPMKGAEMSNEGDRREVNEADLGWFAERDQPLNDEIKVAQERQQVEAYQAEAYQALQQGEKEAKMDEQRARASVSTLSASERTEIRQGRAKYSNVVWVWDLADKCLEALEAAETALTELKAYEAEESAFMAKNGVLYNCTFVDGWQAVLDERDELRTALAEAHSQLKAAEDVEKIRLMQLEYSGALLNAITDILKVPIQEQQPLTAVKRLVAELAEAQKDIARLDFLFSCIVARFNTLCNREAIDAAMAESPKEASKLSL